ncbi:hypothetical protein PG996_008238 [Apiospora saccharicola]|uniref:Uncharacterized protein n=1 Tax=Apiospora saccharicola TaxID=335842 RepID=A0ABR1UXD1_9PEZI
MPKTNATNLSEKDHQMIAVFLAKIRENNKGINASMNWKPYLDAFKFKNERQAKDAFEYICCKLVNIEKTMGSGSSTPNGKSGDATPAAPAAKKAAPDRAQRKRGRTVKNTGGVDLGLVKDEDESDDESDDAPPKKRARVGYTDEEHDDDEI